MLAIKSIYFMGKGFIHYTQENIKDLTCWCYSFCLEFPPVIFPWLNSTYQALQEAFIYSISGSSGEEVNFLPAPITVLPLLSACLKPHKTKSTLKAGAGITQS